MDEQLSSLLYQLGIASLVPIGAILTALGKLMVQKIQLQSLKIKGDNWQKTQLILRTAVMASEKQLQLSKGTDKKKKAMEVAKRLLAKSKITIEEEILSEMIEAQVWDTFDAPVIAINSNVSTNAVKPVTDKSEEPAG